MKKLMFGAALAATSMAFAETQEAQVYDVTFNIKSTKAASAKINNKTNPIAVQDDSTQELFYRVQANYTWKGLIWGCDCNAIDGVWEKVTTCNGEESDIAVKGCVIWDNSSGALKYMGDGADLADYKTVPNKGFGWQFLHVINKDGKKIEANFLMDTNSNLCYDDEAEEYDNDRLFQFAGAGFGTLNVVTEKDDDGLLIPQCTSYIKSISGNFAGVMYAPQMDSTKVSGCTFCGYSYASDCYYSDAWGWCESFDPCDCDVELNPDEAKAYTSAYGTWKVAYNSSLSKKLSKALTLKDAVKDTYVSSITDVYNFKTTKLAGVGRAINTVEEWILNGETDPDCDELEVALAAANAAVKDAEEDLEAVQYTNLKAAEVKAGLVAVAASNAWEDAKYYCSVTNRLYNKSEIEYTKAIYQQTNVNATIIWKNGSTDEVTNKVVGCTAIEAFVIAHNDYTLIKMEAVTPDVYGIRTCFTWTQCTALVEEFRNATKAAEDARDAAKDDLEKAQAAVVTTAAAKVVADDAYTAAQNNLANITSLQYTAEKALEKAEAAQAVAQAAYDDAGCEE